MKAKIKSKREIADNTLFVEFDLLGKEISFSPGQYFFVSLLNPPYTDKKGNQRHFSIVSTPSQKGVLAFATRIRKESAFKLSLAELPLGSEAEIGIVAGDFTLPKDNSKPLIFIAGGIGITPFFSMIKQVVEKGLDYKITLVYSNRNKSSAAFFEELSQISKENNNIKLITIMSDDPGWQGEKGIVDTEFFKNHFSDIDSNLYMVAGPPKMVEAVCGSLSEAGASKKNIKTDNFSGY